jgi:hypothetical protein
MKTKLGLILAAVLISAPAFAQTGTAGGTQNTGPQGTGNFVSGKPGNANKATSGRSGSSGTTNNMSGTSGTSGTSGGMTGSGSSSGSSR